MSNDIISQNALRKAGEAMHMDLGDLDDLPIEFANTLANIYYRFFADIEHSLSMEHRLSGGRNRFLDPYVPQSSDMLDAFENYIKFQAQALSTFKHSKNIVQSIRKVGQKAPELFAYLITETLDEWKYNIENTGSKTPIRRAIERKFKKVYEIPNLLEIMRKDGIDV